MAVVFSNGNTDLSQGMEKSIIKVMSALGLLMVVSVAMIIILPMERTSGNGLPEEAPSAKQGQVSGSPGTGEHGISDGWDEPRRHGSTLPCTTDQGRSKELYLEFVRSLDRVVSSFEGSMFKMLGKEIKYRIHDIAGLLSVPGVFRSLEDPVSVAVARFLGLGVDFVNELDPKSGAEMVSALVAGQWPVELHDTRCVVGSKELFLHEYVGCVLQQYILDCEVEEQRTTASNENIFRNIAFRGHVDDGSIDTPVVRDSGRYITPNAYMNIVREILFVARYDQMAWETEEGGRNASALEELRFLLSLCRRRFNRELSSRFDRFYDISPRRIVRYGDRYVYSSDYSDHKLLSGLLGVEGDSLDGWRKQDESILNHFSILLDFVDSGIVYYPRSTSRGLTMKEYAAGLLVKDLKDRLCAACRVPAKGTSRDFQVEIIGLDLPMEEYMWFLLGVMYGMEPATMVESGSSELLNEHIIELAREDKDVRTRSRRLREELWTSVVESSIWDRTTSDLHPSTRAILRLFGGKGDMFTGEIDPRSRDQRYAIISKYIDSCVPPEMEAQTYRCDGVSIPFKEYISRVIWEYLRECDQEEDLQHLADSRVYNDMNKDLVVRYEDGEVVGDEYFGIVRVLLRDVFCDEENTVFKRAIVDGNPDTNLLRLALRRKERNVDIFFSNAVLGDIGGPSVYDVPDTVLAVVERISGNDPDFMKNLEPDMGEEGLFSSVQSCFSKEYRKIRCSFGQHEFDLVDLVAKVVVEYIKTSPIQNCNMISYLLGIPCGEEIPLFLFLI